MKNSIDDSPTDRFSYEFPSFTVQSKLANKSSGAAIYNQKGDYKP